MKVWFGCFNQSYSFVFLSIETTSIVRNRVVCITKDDFIVNTFVLAETSLEGNIISLSHYSLEKGTIRGIIVIQCEFFGFSFRNISTVGRNCYTNKGLQWDPYSESSSSAAFSSCLIQAWTSVRVQKSAEFILFRRSGRDKWGGVHERTFGRVQPAASDALLTRRLRDVVSEWALSRQMAETNTELWMAGQ